MSNHSDTEMYDYPAQIKYAHELGINDRGTWSQVGRNIRGMENYFKILESGGGSASKHKKTDLGGGMGNRYFVRAKGECKNKEDRHMYMDHIPTHDTSQSAIFDKDVGLIPGLTNNVMKSLDPTNIINALSNSGPDTECVRVRLTEVNSKGEVITPGDDDFKWIAESEANEIDPCWYVGGKRTYIKADDSVFTDENDKCARKDGFANIKDNHTIAKYATDISDGNNMSFPENVRSTEYASVDNSQLDSIETTYIALLSGIGLYAAFRLSTVLN